jgi:hypothetical protein
MKLTCALIIALLLYTADAPVEAADKVTQGPAWQKVELGSAAATYID